MDYETIINTLTDRVKELEQKVKFQDGLLELLADNKIKTYRNEEGEICYQTVE